MIQSNSRTQKAVALSSGEAELTAMVRVTAEGVGLSALLEDWGAKRGLTVFADSSAALGVVQRDAYASCGPRCCGSRT